MILDFLRPKKPTLALESWINQRNAQAQRQQERQTAHSLPVCSVLTPELAQNLDAINRLTRRLRAAGIQIKAATPLDRTLWIEPHKAQSLRFIFAHELRGISRRANGETDLNSVHIGGCRVCWLTPIQEQQP
jgi:hypothetical protein